MKPRSDAVRTLAVLLLITPLFASGCSETNDEHVVVASSPQAPDAAGNFSAARDDGGKQVEPSGRTAPLPSGAGEVALPSENGPAESGEPLPPGHEVIALYQAGRLPQARKALVDWVRRSAEAVKRKETRRAIDLSDKLRHSLAVNLTVYCFKLDRQARGGATAPQELLEAAKDARETMQTVIDETERLEAENSPLVTHRVIQSREYAERQLADLLVQEIGELKDLRRLEDAESLGVQYRRFLNARGISLDRDKEAKDVSLRAKYESLPRDRRRQFLKQLTADQMDQFIRDTLESLTVNMTPEQVRRDRQRLALITGDEFERWGEKLLAEKRRLTHERILKLLKDPTRGLAWRVSFHGYLTVILRQRELNDAYEIGLSKADVKKLREEIPNIEI